jgi:hypothetical protein
MGVSFSVPAPLNSLSPPAKIDLLQLPDQLSLPCAMPLENLLSYISDKAMFASVSQSLNASRVFVTPSQ